MGLFVSAVTIECGRSVWLAWFVTSQSRGPRRAFFVMNPDELKSSIMRVDEVIDWPLIDGVSTGSTLLNMALTGNPHVGFLRGTYSLFVGDTDSGKTFLTMSCFAEAAINPKFDDFRLVMLNKERGVKMDIEKFFGPRVKERLGIMSVERLEDMYFFFDDLLADDKPILCVVDSIDAFTCKAEDDQYKKRKAARAKDEEGKGDHGDGKAKVHSRCIRRFLTSLEKSGSIVVFINQSRDNPAAGPFESSKTHSGGHAISFYATMKLWSTRGKTLMRDFRGKKRSIGALCRVNVRRTRQTGRQRFAEIPIYHSAGVDDVGSCIDYLVSEPATSKWKKNKSGVITSPDFDVEAKREVIVKHVEDNDLEGELRELVAETWDDIERGIAVHRKSRYE